MFALYMTPKKKRQRKNKKWIPYKDLTLEEREQLKRDSNRNRFRKQLIENKMRRSEADASGNYQELAQTPKLTNEVDNFAIILL